MLIRISLIVAILAGIAVIVLGNMQLRTNINTIIEERETEKREHTATRSKLKKTQNELTATEKNLENETKAHTETKASLTRAKSQVEELEKQTADLSQSLETTRNDLTSARQTLSAWDALGIPVEQVQATIAQNAEMRTALEALNQEKQVLAYNNKKLRAELEKYIGTEEYVVEMPVGLRGQVTAVDPKWDFVVLNVGEKDGVLPDGVFLVSRDGKLIAKVRVSSVQPKRSIANVMPGWKLGEIYEGDEAIY